MKVKSKSNRTLALIVIGMGLIAIGAAGIVLLAARKTAGAVDASTLSAIPVKTNYPAPNLTLQDPDGNQHSLSDYLGQVVLVNMWASWCPPCVSELPTLNDFHEDHTGDGFVVIGINDGEEIDVVRDYVAETGLVFPVWVDPNWLSESAFNTMNLPSSFLIDRSGQVRLQWVGAISRAMLDKYILPVILE